VLTEAGAVTGVAIRGAAPGTRETDLLSPLASIERIHAVLLSGGSAFGLDAASGVVRWLEERGIGLDVGVARVPLVPAAVLFDLPIGDAKIRPTAECGYRAAAAASDQPVGEGSVGAGAGATVGKLLGRERAVKGGIGSAAIRLSNGLIVAALVATNGVGDVIDPASGTVVAGVRSEDGRSFADARRLLREGVLPPWHFQGQNTTLGVIATNARLTKAQAAKVADMAHDGLARATGTLEATADIFAVGALAADVMAEAIVRGARQATSAAGVPAARDLAK
jgi:L-aminopeptidase/D-esterase-like protein